MVGENITQSIFVCGRIMVDLNTTSFIKQMNDQEDPTITNGGCNWNRMENMTYNQINAIAP